METMAPSLTCLAISHDAFDVGHFAALSTQDTLALTPLSSSGGSSASSPCAVGGEKSPTLKKKTKRSAKVLGGAKRVSSEEKQAKNRLFVKRCYYKKREALKNLREEVAALETQFAGVLENWQRRNEGAASAFCLGQRSITPQDLYAELTVVRGELLDEQQRLNLRLADRHLFRQRLQQLYEPTR